jgi:hypothetical protein
VIVFAVGSTDRLFYRLHISYPAQIHFWRIGVWVLPVLVFLLTRSVCRSLQRSGAHPLRAWQGEIVRQRPDGAIEVLSDGADGRGAVRDTEPAVGTPPGQESRTHS